MVNSDETKSVIKELEAWLQSLLPVLTCYKQMYMYTVVPCYAHWLGATPVE